MIENETTPEDTNETVPLIESAPTRNILIITKRQREALSQLGDDKLMRFQMVFNMIVNLVTDGEA